MNDPLERRRHGSRIGPIAALLTIVVSFGCETTPATAPSKLLAARAALQPFKSQLMAALQAGLTTGYAAAIDACRVEAHEIARSHTTDRLRLGRTSHRLRNPANAPKPWLEPILDELREAQPGEIAYRLVPLDDGRAGYAEPIYLRPMCLGCHGDELDPETRRRLRERYPEDRATGFAAGEFRGLFWVELEADGEGV